MCSYQLVGYPLNNEVPGPLEKPAPVQTSKDPFFTDSPSANTHINTTNESLPEIKTSLRENYTEFMSDDIERLLKEQILILRCILLFLGVLLISNVLNKN